MKKIIQDILTDSIEVKKTNIQSNMDNIVLASNKLVSCLEAGGKILIFGNGGSAADAQHLAAEFVNRFAIERPPLAAIALTTDSSILTSIGNDYNFNEIFEKQLKAFGKKEDIAWGITTSGNSENVVKGIKKAKNMGIYTIGMTGCGGNICDYADLILSVNSDTTARIQETHITMGHILCELVDRQMFPQV
ncbi:MAG: phosphoheptose isomerase [Desulfobacteraceae bacterium 4572_19]|nr:MAG: phosphoheptose isomerase [Desulfobacteraceae bacterium 4572_19]